MLHGLLTFASHLPLSLVLSCSYMSESPGKLLKMTGAPSSRGPGGAQMFVI